MLIGFLLVFPTSVYYLFLDSDSIFSEVLQYALAFLPVTKRDYEWGIRLYMV